MKSLFSGWVTRFDALARRERLLVAVALLGGVLLIGWVTLIDPALASSRSAERAIVDQRAQLAALVAQSAALQAPGQSPEALAGARLAELRQQLSALNERFVALDDKLVPPQRVAALLEDMLGRKSGLRLLSLRTLPVTPLLETGESGGAASAKPATAAKPAAGLFKHGVEIRLEGSYAELTDYLERLEKSPQSLLWSGVSLSAEKHPQLVLTLTVFTLSLDRTWLIV